jgi:hypothetical protein
MLVWAGVFSVLALVVAPCASCTLLLRARTLQINNSLRVLQVSSEIVQAHSTTGAYPPSVDARDYWGNPLIYCRNDRHFVLASAGRDNEPDRQDYCELLVTTGPFQRIDNCSSPSQDTIFLDGSPWQACLK